MSNPIRVATAALSGRIFAGRPTKDGMGFKEPRYDVTSDVLKAVVDKIGIGFQTDIVSDGEVVCTIKIVGPDHPAAPSADKLRIAVEALEKARDRLERIRWVREFYTDGKHIATVTKDDISPAVEGIDQALAALEAEGAK